MSLKMYDFRCTGCGHTWEDLSEYSETLRTVQPIPCERCAAPSFHYWKHGTRLAMRGEMSDADKKMASMFLGVPVTTRAEAERIRKERGLVELDEKSFDSMVMEAAHYEEEVPKERELSKDEMDSTIAQINQARERIQVARDHGDLPAAGSLEHLPQSVREVAGV